MFKGDMNKKRAKALQKVKEAITLHGGQTIRNNWRRCAPGESRV
ncbi:TPA: hypothetical protein ACHYGO_003391 [Salmonella enterica]